VLILRSPGAVGGIVFVAVGVVLAPAGIWMLVTGRPRSLPS
jgi:hypothetical protein